MDSSLYNSNILFSDSVIYKLYIYMWINRLTGGTSRRNYMELKHLKIV
jgi:hypothetical protein